MFIFDAHCDTLSTQQNLTRNSGHFDLERAAARGKGVQVMAAFGKNQIEQLRKLRRYNETVKYEGFSLLPSVEGGYTIHNLADLEPFINYNPVFFGLMWNKNNALGGGCLDKPKGLTKLGREVVKTLEENNILIDVSHCSEQTFWDILSVARKPVVASHSCSRTLCNHPRNLTNEQMNAIAETGGVVGITFYSPFLVADRRATIDDVVRHIYKAGEVMGENHIGLGSDFDGCEDLPENLQGCEDVPKILYRLRVRDRVKEKISGANFLRVIS